MCMRVCNTLVLIVHNPIHRISIHILACINTYLSIYIHTKPRKKNKNTESERERIEENKGRERKGETENWRKNE